MPDQTQFYLTARKQTPTKPRVCILCPLRICFGSTMTDSARSDPSRPKLTQSGHIESINIQISEAGHAVVKFKS